MKFLKILIVLFCFSCGGSPNDLLLDGKILSIDVFYMVNHSYVHVTSLSDADSVSVLVNAIKSAKKTHARFIPKYKLILHCQERFITFFVNEKYLSASGQAFRLNPSIIQFLENAPRSKK